MDTTDMIQKDSTRTSLAKAFRAQEAARRVTRGRTLYNGSTEEPVTFQYGGVRYTIPPNGETTKDCSCDPDLAKPGLVSTKGKVRTYDGTLQVFDVIGVKPSEYVKYRTAKANGERVREPKKDHIFMTADKIVEHAIEKLAKRGVCHLWMDDNPEQDEAEKQAANERALEFRRGQVDKIIAQMERASAEFYAKPSNRGQAPPMPRPHELKAIEWRDADRLQLHGVEMILCPAGCQYRTEKSEKMEIHMKAAHPMYERVEEVVTAAPPPKTKKTQPQAAA